MFTLENTSGYTQAQLDTMNHELEQLLINELGNDYIDHEDYDHYLKNYSDQIFNKYCNVEKFRDREPGRG